MHLSDSFSPKKDAALIYTRKNIKFESLEVRARNQKASFCKPNAEQCSSPFLSHQAYIPFKEFLFAIAFAIIPYDIKISAELTWLPVKRSIPS